MTTPLRLRRLLNADGEVVGYFSDHVAEMAARREWDRSYDRSFDYATQTMRCRSIETSIVAAELEDVEPGDGDRVDYIFAKKPFESMTGWNDNDEEASLDTECQQRKWYLRGAASVEVRRYLVNRYRRPGVSNRDADLGGPQEAAGVLYVLVVKAPK